MFRFQERCEFSAFLPHPFIPTLSYLGGNWTYSSGYELLLFWVLVCLQTHFLKISTQVDGVKNEQGKQGPPISLNGNYHHLRVETCDQDQLSHPVILPEVLLER